MVTRKVNYNCSKDVGTIAPTQANAITKEYYWHLVGEINRGVVKAAVCRIETLPFGTFSYHLISN